MPLTALFSNPVISVSDSCFCDTLAPMSNNKESDASAGRLKRFAEIYQEKMAKRPYMEILARYDSMTEAKLVVAERIQADLYLDTHRLNEFLHPEDSETILKAV